MAAGGDDDNGSRRGHGTNGEQLADDAALVARIASAGFAGEEYEAFRRRLAEIGFVVLLGQLVTGEIFRACATVRRPLFPRAAELHRLAVSAEDRTALAADTAMLGLDLFLRVGVEGGKWIPAGGATLVTYYVGACVRCFPQVFRTWRRDRERDEACRGYGTDASSEPALHARHATGLGPVTFVELVEELAAMPPAVRYAAVQMMFHNRTHAEIAKDLGISAAALGERLRRYRTTRCTAPRKEAR